MRARLGKISVFSCRYGIYWAQYDKSFRFWHIEILIEFQYRTRAIGIAHKIVSAFSTSWKRWRELTKCQINLNLPKHSLISDCKTRWGSTQKMIACLIEQDQPICVVLSADRKVSHLVHTWQDVDVCVWKGMNEALSVTISRFHCHHVR